METSDTTFVIDLHMNNEYEDVLNKSTEVDIFAFLVCAQIRVPS